MEQVVNLYIKETLSYECFYISYTPLNGVSSKSVYSMCVCVSFSISLFFPIDNLICLPSTNRFMIALRSKYV